MCSFYSGINTFMNDFITFAGGENIASDLTRGTITRESVLLRNPDVIVIVTMGILAEEEKDRWASSKQLNAAKNKTRTPGKPATISCKNRPDFQWPLKKVKTCRKDGDEEENVFHVILFTTEAKEYTQSTQCLYILHNWL